MVVCVEEGGGGHLINMELRKLFSRSLLRCIEAHSGFVCPDSGFVYEWTHTVVSRSHTVVVCVDGWGGIPYKHGA